MDNNDNAYSSLGDQAKKIDIALHYVSGDMEKAKKMVANSYQDMVAMKGKFSSSSLYGSFLLFFNKYYGTLEHALFVVSPDYQLESMNNREDWKIFEKEIMTVRNAGSASRVNNDFSDKFQKGFTLTFGKEIGRLIDKNDTTQIMYLFQRFMQESTELKRIEVDIELQKTSSLQMELDSVTSKKITLKKKDEDEAKNSSGSLPSESDEPQVGINGVKLILSGALVLSPIKGKHISLINSGDKIMISIIDSAPQAVEIAKAFNAYDAEQKRIDPLPGRVKSVNYVDGVGYKIFAIIAKGIIAKIVEEEGNIKVALDPAYQSSIEPDEAKSSSALPMIIGLVTAILLLLLFVVLVLL